VPLFTSCGLGLGIVILVLVLRIWSCLYITDADSLLIYVGRRIVVAQSNRSRIVVLNHRLRRWAFIQRTWVRVLHWRLHESPEWFINGDVREGIQQKLLPCTVNFR